MHVVVLGAGYAGLTLTRSLEETLPEDVDITLVDESPDHLVQHELHRVVRRPELATAITVSLPAVLERATVRVARVEGVDREDRRVSLSDGTLSYDVGAICLGAQPAYYDLEGVREHATPLKRLSHANRIRSQALAVLRSRSNGRIVVVGAGLSGVQVAGELAALARAEPGDATITLLEQLESVAPNFPATFQRAVRTALTDQGIDVRTDSAVLRADETHVTLESGDRVPYDQFVWTGGIRGPDALGGERSAVQSDLRLDERTFVLGDAARVTDADGEAVPASAQAAIREARTVAASVSRIVDAAGEPAPESENDRNGFAFDSELESFSFDSPGWLVSIGDDAVAQVGPAVLTGRTAKLLKSGVGMRYLSSVGAIGNAVGLGRNDFDDQY